MFLKQIEMQGFKSFADKVVINFESPVTGIVGPNGCGKSNITDAVKWVLGEQSVKSMRGSTMTDVIFNGSGNRRKVNLAEVTLIFDNSDHILHTEYQEVEITRRLHRDTREGEYFINKKPCRLRDVLDLILDTGLGRDSLSMISQGSISFFAEAKPIERRALFEEAAGVSKYKKRKIESLSKLERTQENIERMQDIVDELQRQVIPLKRAAKKARIYHEKKDELKKIEVSVLVRDIHRADQTLETDSSKQFNLSAEIASLETAIQVFENQIQQQKEEISLMDKLVSQYQEDLMNVVHEIQILETRKVEIDEKRKYILEIGNQQERITELNAMVNDALQEYQDRLNRQKELRADIDILNQQSIDCNRDRIILSGDLDIIQSKIRRLISRQEVLKNIIDRPFEAQAGVSAIMNNKDNLVGIKNVTAKILLPQEGYENAIGTALGAAMMHIVTADEKAARNAISFLKRNMSGRATFIPLTVLRARSIARDAMIVAQNTEGFLGCAADYVSCEEEFDILAFSLLGNVLVCDTLEHANTLASLLKYQFKIVTLEGDVIHRGGTMTGGKQRENNSLLSAESDLKKIVAQLEEEQINQTNKQVNVSSLEQQKNTIDQELMNKRIALAQIESLVDVKRAKYERLKNELEELNPDAMESDISFKDELVEQLNAVYQRRDELNMAIRLKRDERLKANADAERREVQIRQQRKELNTLVGSEHQIQLEIAKLQSTREFNLSRLSSEYQYTYEFALEEVGLNEDGFAGDTVTTLREEIAALGNINMTAPEEFEEVNERYEFLTHQLNDLVESRDKILSLIDEMDEVMKVQFKEMFEKINGELDGVFKALFNGGSASLTLEDPDDLLNTGIDINVQPPGKSVQNIRLFSGGEKSLIAISVLFAILKARHMPLCIFDEVEAALDQGNVERVANYMKSFSKETQFIVVTHRPGTMTKCDILYGVTMPTQGVSQMLKVRLSDALQFSEGVKE